MFTGFKYIIIWGGGTQFNPLHWPTSKWVFGWLENAPLCLAASLKKGSAHWVGFRGKTSPSLYLSLGLPNVPAVTY